MIRKRQEEWNRGTKGRPYNSIQKKVREMRETSRTKKKKRRYSFKDEIWTHWS